METTNKIHYVYKITNLNPTDERLYYIGVKSSSNPLTDNYMGSSKYLDKSIEEIGIKNFKKEVLSTWDTRKLAMQEEIRLHQKINVALDEAYYNKANANSTKFDTSGAKMSDTQKEYISKLYKGRKHLISEETKKKISTSNIGNIHTIETKDKIRAKAIGRKASSSTKQKMSDVHLGREKTQAWKDNIAKANTGNMKRVQLINIYNDKGVLQFTSDTTFKTFCKNNNLPFTALYRSHSNNGSLLFQSVNGMIKEEMLKYKGWYAIKQES